MYKDSSDTEVVIPSTPWRFFWYILLQNKGWAVAAVLLVTAAAVLSAGSSYFFKLIIDAVEASDADLAMRYGLLFPVVLLSIQMLYRASGFCGLRLVAGSNKIVFDTLTNYVLKHSHTYFSNRFAGSVTNKIRNVTGAFDQMIPDFLWGHLNALVMFIVTFGLMLQVDLTVGYLFATLIVVLLLVNSRLGHKKATIAKQYAESSTKLQGYLSDSVANVSVVRQYAAISREMEELKQLSSTRYVFGVQNWAYTEKLLTLNSVILFAFALGIFYILVENWKLGQIATGDFILILALVSSMASTLLFIGRAFNATARTLGELEEGLEDILIPYEIFDNANAKTLKVAKGEIVFKDLTFGFSDEVIFKNFNLSVSPRQRLGVVGTSGAGKSTIVALLLRQYDLKSGEIIIDGQPINSVTQNSLSEAIAIVPQEPALFHRSIRDNIAYGNPGASHNDVLLAAKRAYAHDFIAALPDGYDTLVGERGVKLSGGQKQRVAIARAMLKNAPILILDEATSALDSESEAEIQKALHELMADKTVIAIAHRLSTLREMDRIIVLENGQITEDGNHTSLQNSGGLYSRLWSHQAGGFLSE